MEISIIIPAYNETKRIKNALESVIRFLDVYHKIILYEIIIVDDGSKDNTINLIPKNKHIIQ